MNVRGPQGEQLIDPRPFAGRRSQESADPLDVLSLPKTARHDDGNLSIGDIESLVQHLARNKRAQLPFAEAGVLYSAFRGSNIALLRHEEVMGGDAVCRLVVACEDEDAGVAMALQYTGE